MSQGVASIKNTEKPKKYVGHTIPTVVYCMMVLRLSSEFQEVVIGFITTKMVVVKIYLMIDHQKLTFIFYISSRGGSVRYTIVRLHMPHRE